MVSTACGEKEKENLCSHRCQDTNASAFTMSIPCPTPTSNLFLHLSRGSNQWEKKVCFMDRVFCPFGRGIVLNGSGTKWERHGVLRLIFWSFEWQPYTKTFPVKRTLPFSVLNPRENRWEYILPTGREQDPKDHVPWTESFTCVYLLKEPLLR